MKTQVSGQGWRGVACCRAALCFRAAFHVYRRCFSTPPPIGHACCAASHCGDLGAWPRTKGECRVCARVSEPAAARGSPQSSPGRPQSQVDRGPADAHRVSGGLRRARDVYARALSIIIGHVSHRRANGPYGIPLCVLTFSTGIQVPISFSSHALPAPFKLPTWGQK